jgi:hypothetical protein
VVKATPPPLYPREKGTRYPLYKRLGGPQGWSGQVRKISPHTGFRYTDRPAHSESLYRQSYPGPCFSQLANLKLHLSVLHPICTSIKRDISLKNTFLKRFPPDQCLTGGANAVSASRRASSSKISQSAHVLTVNMFYSAENMGSGTFTVHVLMSWALRYIMTTQVRKKNHNIQKK